MNCRAVLLLTSMLLIWQSFCFLTVSSQTNRITTPTVKNNMYTSIPTVPNTATSLLNTQSLQNMQGAVNPLYSYQNQNLQNIQSTVNPLYSYQNQQLQNLQNMQSTVNPLYNYQNQVYNVNNMQNKWNTMYPYQQQSLNMQNMQSMVNPMYYNQQQLYNVPNKWNPTYTYQQPLQNMNIPQTQYSLIRKTPTITYPMIYRRSNVPVGGLLLTQPSLTIGRNVQSWPTMNSMYGGMREDLNLGFPIGQTSVQYNGDFFGAPQARLIDSNMMFPAGMIYT